MPYKIREFQETPNPNALKCVVDRKLAEKPRSYFKAADAVGDPVAAALFAIPGVTNILINADWVTVSKRPDADWKAIKRGVERVMNEA
jgi:hypothetical protein